MKILFLDCISGISGDMTVGALTDLGVQPSTFEWELSKVDIGDFHMHFERKTRQSIAGIKFGIHEGATHSHDQEEEEDEHHHHEHEHERGEHEHEHGPGNEHHHEHGPECHHSHEEGHHEHAHEHHEEEHHEHQHGHHHHHEHEHAHGDESHEHVHASRSHREIRDLISGSGLSEFVKQKSLAIFQRIAVAEGKIHGMAPEEVTFHEVGALDSIADIICACVGIEALGVEKVLVSKLFEGTGWIHCDHGRFPIPAPATLEILKGIPLSQIDEAFEFITPTGAAIIAEFGSGFAVMPEVTVEKIGYGIGTRQSRNRPNVLRAVLGEMDAPR